MNSYKNARLTFARRVEMIHDPTQRGVNISAAALAHGVTPPTARKWLGRFLTLGGAGRANASSRPAHSPQSQSHCLRQSAGHRGTARTSIPMRK